MFLCFLDNVPLELQSVYKCIKKDLPRSATWVFSENERTGNLKFENWSAKDSNSGFLKDVSGFGAPSFRDSGSPYWWTSSDSYGGNENKAILVAIATSKIGQFDEVAGIRDSYHQCISRATKITSEILEWAKEKSGMLNDEGYYYQVIIIYDTLEISKTLKCS